MEQQRAAEAAGHEYMEVVDEKFDDITEINEEHFEMATSEARCSLSRGTILRAGRDRSFSASQGQGSGIGDRDGENLYAQKVAWRETAGVGERERER